MKYAGWYSPEAYYYNKHTDVLRRTVCIEYEKYFDGDDYAWEEKPIFKEITNIDEKERVLKENPELLKEYGK